MQLAPSASHDAGRGWWRVGAYDDHGDFADDASVYGIRVPQHLLQLVDRRMCQRRVDKDGVTVEMFPPCERNAYVSHVSEVLGDILCRPKVDRGVGEGAVGGVQADVPAPWKQRAIQQMNIIVWEDCCVLGVWPDVIHDLVEGIRRE